MKKSELGKLRERIEKQAAEGRAIRVRIGRARDRERYNLWDEKRLVGGDTRYLLLTYAFLRGVPYRVVEPTARVKPISFGGTAEQWRKHWAAGLAGVAAEFSGVPLDGTLSKSLEDWLALPEVQERTLAREEARKAWFARRDARRAASAAARQQRQQGAA